MSWVAAAAAGATPVMASCACGPAAGVPLDGNPGLAWRSWVTGTAVLTTPMMGAAVLTTTILAVIVRGALLLTAAMIPFLYGNALSLSLFFGRLFWPGIAIRRQFDLAQDLGAFQFFRLDIFDNGRCFIFFGGWLLGGLAGDRCGSFLFRFLNCRCSGSGIDLSDRGLFLYCFRRFGFLFNGFPALLWPG